MMDTDPRRSLQDFSRTIPLTIGEDASGELVAATVSSIRGNNDFVLQSVSSRPNPNPIEPDRHHLVEFSYSALRKRNTSSSLTVFIPFERP